MRAVIQRVAKANVVVEGTMVADIQTEGLLILLGIGPNDDEKLAQQLAKKISAMRIFHDDEGKMNRSVKDINGEAIVVSQFTLYADCSRGNRPSFTGAALPEKAAPLVDSFVADLQKYGVPTQTGIFGAEMKVELLNDGPVTIVVEMENPAV